MEMRQFTRLITSLVTPYLKKGGKEVEVKRRGDIDIVEIFAFPQEAEIPAGQIKVDLVFFAAAIDMAEVELHKEDLLAMIHELEDLMEEKGMPMRYGQSYIHLGGVIGSQQVALLTMALCKALNLWGLVTPYSMGEYDQERAKHAAGMGFIYSIKLPEEAKAETP